MPRRAGRGRAGGVKAVQAPDQRFVYSGLRFDPLNGGMLKADKDAFLVGSAPGADLHFDGENVALEHAKLEFEWGRLFCTALLGEEGEKDSASYTWIDGVQLLPGIRYLVAPGSKITFGDEPSSIRVDFEEQSGIAQMLESMIMAWAAACSKKSKKEIEKFFDKS